MTYSPKYATITMEETRILTRNKAPRSVWSVLFVLNSYAQDGFSSFPSLNTIKTQLEDVFTIRTIERALKWLVDYNVIIRQAKNSIHRFVNKVRQMIYGKVEEIEEPETTFQKEETVKKEEIAFQEESTRQPMSCTTRQTMSLEENHVKEQNPPLYSPLEGGKKIETKKERKRKNRKGMIHQLKRAERKVQSIKNVLNNIMPDNNQPIDKTQSLITDLVRSKRQPNPLEVKILQDKAEKDEKWRYWCMAYQPPLWMSISGIRLRDEEVQYAMKKWIDLDCKGISMDIFKR